MFAPAEPVAGGVAFCVFSNLLLRQLAKTRKIVPPPQAGETRVLHVNTRRARAAVATAATPDMTGASRGRTRQNRSPPPPAQTEHQRRSPPPDPWNTMAKTKMGDKRPPTREEVVQAFEDFRKEEVGCRVCVGAVS